MKKRFRNILISATEAVTLAVSMSSCDVMTGYLGMGVGTGGPYFNNPPAVQPVPNPMPLIARRGQRLTVHFSRSN